MKYVGTSEYHNVLANKSSLHESKNAVNVVYADTAAKSCALAAVK